LRSSVIEICDSAKSKFLVWPATSASQATLTIATLSSPARCAISAARQYSKPSLIASGVSPFQKPGAGRLTSTVSCPATAGVSATEPLAPVTAQLPIMSAAPAGAAATTAATASDISIFFMRTSQSCL